MRRHVSVRVVLMMAAMLAPGAVASARAEPVQIKSTYSVSLLGLPVASARFRTVIDGKSYTISGDVRTTVLSDIVSKIRGTTSVSGTMTEERMLASKFLVNYASGTKTYRTEIIFHGGNVKSVINLPKRRETSEDWVPLSADDMRAVLDPLSALVLPAGSKVCPRSLPIFDGQSRVTLHLTQKGVRPYRNRGFVGDAIVCAVRFDPKAGYRKGSSGIEYLRELRTMEIWFAHHERGGFYAPVYAKVPTKIGQVIIAATRFDG
ncbi:DUF3108 domain-containing protein [Hoeflea sp. YIM 152468]|uniref:DUF3108 domain-containing protein n=1 Tax=Hoeflea sp. YIM 152468 TaxID=3031759 RepID=UPI0023DB2371|nr:DUF3108 domain-containing protein [Hoeflea sp. YIM 152468]MDF1608065.1 DUF3108 domain-containing protein [Hoeflea sp. YIM 152468]